MEKLNLGNYPGNYGIQIKYLKTYLHILRFQNECKSVFYQTKLDGAILGVFTQKTSSLLLASAQRITLKAL